MPVHPRFSATSIGELEGLVFGLAAQSYAQMRDAKLGVGGRPLPPLYGGSIRYKREPIRRENWQGAQETAELGYGDCEDLAAYRVAELRAKGIKAFPVVSQVSPTLRHVTIRYLDPKTNQWVPEDPSKRLGM
jgi:hypothetical protein